MGSNEYDSEIWRQGHIEKFSVSWYETVLAKMEREFDIVVAENAELRDANVRLLKKLRCIIKDATLNECICLICKYKDLDAKEEPCMRCIGKSPIMSGLCWKSTEDTDEND